MVVPEANWRVFQGLGCATGCNLMRDRWVGELRDGRGPSVAASVLVFNNHTAALQTLKCLRAQTSRPVATVLIDNGSDQPLDCFLRDCGVELLPGESVVRTEGNRGVGYGHNFGIGEALAVGADYIWLLEHDTYVLPQCLDSLLSILECVENPARVAVLPTLARNRYEGELLSRGEGLPGERSLPKGLRGHLLTFNGLLLSAELARIAPPIREDLVVGYEDLEYNAALRRADATIISSAEVLGVHPNRGLGRYPEPQSPRRCYYAVRNHLWIEREAMGRVPLWAAARACGGLARDALRNDGQTFRLRLRGIVDGLRGSDVGARTEGVRGA